MRKFLFLLLAFPLILLITFYGWFALTSGEHHYRHDDYFFDWFYTPEILKNVPLLSSEAEYRYDYDLDHQRTNVTITWRHISDISAKKKLLIDFLYRLGPSLKYDCLWVYHDPQDYADNYQRYCVSQKGDTLELAYYETVK